VDDDDVEIHVTLQINILIL